MNALVKSLDCPQYRVTSAFAHGLDEPGHRGSIAALDDNCKRQILDWVPQVAEQKIIVTKGQIMDYCTAQFQIPIT
jgi:hypothetical protein